MTKTNQFLSSAIIVLTLSILSIVNSTEMQIINNLNTDQITQINLIRSIRKYRHREINLNSIPYICITQLKPQPYQSTKLPNPKPPTPSPEAYSLLNILTDRIGVKFTTKEFLYGYWHKNIVSQFDDQFTKYMNQKQEMENFTLGLFSDTQRESERERENEKQRLKEEKGKANNNGKDEEKEEEISVDKIEYKNYANYLSEVDQPSRGQTIFPYLKIEAPSSKCQESIEPPYISHQNSLIHLFSPLQSSSHIIPRSYSLKFSCPSATPNNSFIHSTTGISISNYEISVLSEIPLQCTSINSITAEEWLFNEENVVIVNGYLIGNLDEFCGIQLANAALKGEMFLIEVERTIEPASKTGPSKKKIFTSENIELVVDVESGGEQVIKIEKPNNLEKEVITEYFYIRVEDIVGENAYKISPSLSLDYTPKNCVKLGLSPSKTINYTGHLPLSPSLAPQPLNSSDLNAPLILTYTGHRIIQSTSLELELGQDLYCSSKFSIGDEEEDDVELAVQNLQITIGKTIGNLGHYEIYPWISLEIWNLFGLIGEYESSWICTPYLNKPQLQTPQETPDQATSKPYEIFKLTKSQSPQFPLRASKSNILHITLTPASITEITTITKSTDTNIHTNVTIINKYYLTDNKIYLSETILLSENANANITTKKIITEKMENSLYENSTNQGEILVYAGQATDKGGIWRAGDFGKFPRFLFRKGEIIQDVRVKEGAAFVRIFNMSNLEHENFLLSSLSFWNHEGYGLSSRPSSSISTSYEFLHGTQCGGNINRPRQVTVKIFCGESWFKFESVSEVSPCKYEIKLETQFLCEENMYFAGKPINTFNGSLCVPKEVYDAM